MKVQVKHVQTWKIDDFVRNLVREHVQACAGDCGSSKRCSTSISVVIIDRWQVIELSSILLSAI